VSGPLAARWPVLLLAVALLGAAGCEVHVGPTSVTRGSGNVKSESRSVSGFNHVIVDGVGTLNITQGGSESLTIQAEDNLLPLLDSNVSGGTLEIGPTPNAQVIPTKPIEYDLTVKQLQGVEVTGATDVKASSLDADQLNLTVTGASHMNLGRVTTGSLTVDVTGSGEVDLSGQAPKQTITISGSGKYLASNLASEQATVEVTGAGDCELRVSSHLSATITGSGHVTYTGTPTVDERITGAGTISKAG